MVHDRHTASATDTASSGLLERVKARDAQAWERLCRTYGPLVYRWARHAGLQDQDAADVGQEVFRTVLARVGGFRHEQPGDSFRGWLWTITRNKLGDHFRQRQLRPQGVGGTSANEHFHQLLSPPLESPISTDRQASDRHLVLQRTLELLRGEFSEGIWNAFWRSTVDGRAAVDVAAELGMTAHAVRQAKYRVLRRLRREVDELEA